MRHNPGVAAIIAVSLSVAMLSGCAAPPTPRAEGALPAEAVAARDEARDELARKGLLSDEIMASLVPADQPGCSAAIGIEGEVVWAGAAGMADLANGVPVTTETRFDFASLSKQFTATAILLLKREGKLALSDPISKYVDRLPAWGSRVTLEQLMHHTSRIPDYWVTLDDVGIGFGDPADQAATVDAIRRLPRLASDTGFLYSNSNYVLLAEVVGRVSGTPLPQYLADAVFGPLGLDMQIAPTLVAPDIAVSYDENARPWIAGWTAYGHTGLITTPSELVRWGDQYREGDLIQNDFADNPASKADEPARYAAGINIQPDGTLSHIGRMGGYVSTFNVAPNRKTVMVVACNGRKSDRFGIADALAALWEPRLTVAR